MKDITLKSTYSQERNRYCRILLIGLVAVIIISILSICTGRLSASPSEVIQALLYPEKLPRLNDAVILSRIPRLITSIFVGAALSVAGLVYQEVFNNRMASPDILGVSAGAGVGASIAIWISVGTVLTGLFAFLGGIAAVLLTIWISRLFEKESHYSFSLILSGIVVGGLMNSILGFLKYYSNDAQLSSITFWLMGSFKNANYKQIVVSCPIIFVCLLLLFFMRWEINMLRGGVQDAITHGINANRVKWISIVCTTVMTALAICMSGTVGWIGLAIPNLARLLVRNDGKHLFLLTLIYGVAFTELCDLLARTLQNTEIPVGIISGLLGAILFITIFGIQKHRKR